MIEDRDVKVGMQGACREIARRFPGRAFALIVFPSEEGQTATYASNAPREKVRQALNEINAGGLPDLPSRNPVN